MRKILASVILCLTLLSLSHNSQANPSPVSDVDTFKYFSITIDYTKSLREMIRRGHYKFVDKQINTKNFTLPPWSRGRRQMTLVLMEIGYPRSIALVDVEKELRALGFRPANLFELLAFGASHHEELCGFEHPVWAFGDFMFAKDLGGENNILVPVIHEDDPHCGLRLRAGRPWPAVSSGWRLLAVPLGQKEERR